jgi:hypothetical protein
LAIAEDAQVSPAVSPALQKNGGKGHRFILWAFAGTVLELTAVAFYACSTSMKASKAM